MTVIYKITNRLNGKPYVGQTRQPIERRFIQHSKADSPLGQAMRQCGLDNFTIEIIEECANQDQATKREQFWIKVLNSKVPNGYNQRHGGTGGKKIKPAPMKDRIRKLRKELLHLNQTEFGRKIGIGQQSIANIENGTNALTERNFDAICRTWSVNPDWLRNGVGEVFIEQKKAVLQSLVREFELEPEEAALVEALLELPPEFRAGVVNYVKEAAAAFEKIHAQNLADVPPYRMTPAQKRELINHQLDLEEEAAKRATASSVSTTNISKPTDLKAKSQ